MPFPFRRLPSSAVLFADPESAGITLSMCAVWLVCVAVVAVWPLVEAHRALDQLAAMPEMSPIGIRALNLFTGLEALILAVVAIAAGMASAAMVINSRRRAAGTSRTAWMLTALPLCLPALGDLQLYCNRYHHYISAERLWLGEGIVLLAACFTLWLARPRGALRRFSAYSQ